MGTAAWRKRPPTARQVVRRPLVTVEDYCCQEVAKGPNLE
jgi:hypothetical protein